MALYMLSGTPDESNELDYIGRRSKSQRKAAHQAKRSARKEKHAVKKSARKEKHAVKKSARKTKHAAKKAIRKERRKEGKGLLSKVLKVPAAPSRAAFLAAVRLNALHLADKLVLAYKKDSRQLETWWRKAGGNFSQLRTAISKGAKVSLSGTEVGSVAATLAAATPMIVAVIALFKNMGLFKNKEEEMAYEDAAREGTAQLEQDPDVEETYAEMPEDSGGVAPMRKAAPADDYQDYSADDSESFDESDGESSYRSADKDGEEPKDNKTLLYVGLAAAALFFMTRKK